MTRPRPRNLAHRPRLEPLELRALMSADYGQWPLRGSDPSSSLLVKFSDSGASTADRIMLAMVSGYVAQTFEDGTSLVDLGQGVVPTNAATLFQTNPNVAFAEPNATIQIAATPNDPSYPQQYGLHQSNGIDVGAASAWDVTTGSPPTIVAIVDTGIDMNNPDLASRLWTNPADGSHGYNFVTNTNNPQDDNGHGSHVSGIIGAATNNGIGVAGVNWNAQLMAVKFLDSNGSGTTAGAISAIEWAADHGAKVINASWGGGGNDPALSAAITYAGNAGAIFVAAAGNNGSNNDTSPFYPASYTLPNMLTVAAVDSNGNLASFSNYGANSVDLAAPGVNIYSTYLNGYATLSGTSMATPFVTGVVSLLEGLYPTDTTAQIIAMVKAGVKPLASLQGKTITGGEVNAARSIALAQPATQIADDSSPGGFATTGTWTNVVGSGYDNTYRSASGTGSDVATWSYLLTPGTYRVSATWTAGTNRASNSPFTVLDNGTSIGSVAVNEKVAPVGFTDAGGTWQDLGYFTVTSQSLKVTLGDNANGLVIADAIRVQKVTAQSTAQVFDGTTSIANGGSDAFGSTPVGTPVVKTFTVKNAGTANLTLTDPITLPAGFTLVSDFASTNLAPGASTTFAVKLAAAAAGSYSGSVSFATNDPGNARYSFTVSGTVTVAKAQVFDGTTQITDGGSDAFGSTPVGTPVVKTFTVKNNGTANLTLTDPITLPAGFTLASDFGSTNLAPGASTTFAVKLAAAAGSYSGVLSFRTSDPSITVFNFTITGTVTVPTAGPVQIVDDSSSAGFSTVGTWSQYPNQGYLNTIHFARGGGGADIATWAFNVTPGAQYRVSITWYAVSNRATNSPYTVYDGNASQGTTLVNQQLSPVGFTDAGGTWQDLGYFTVASNNLKVTLNDNANQYVIADAVRIQQVNTVAAPQAQVFDGSTPIANTGLDGFGATIVGTPVLKTFTVTNAGTTNLTLTDPIALPSGFSLVHDFGSTSLVPEASTTFAISLTAAVAGVYSGALSFATNDPANPTFSINITGTTMVPVGPSTIIDDSMAAFSTVGTWSTYPNQGYLNGIHFAKGGGGADVATWSFSVTPGSEYRVSATWFAVANRATNSPYTVYDGGSPLGTSLVNQQLSPTDFTDSGVGWKDLGYFTVTGRILNVTLNDNANWYVIADAIRIQKI